MLIKTKLILGQRVYYLEKKKDHGEWIECPACKGEKKKKINDYEYRCLTCDYNSLGKIWNPFPEKYELKSSPIEKIQVQITNEMMKVQYVLNSFILFSDEEIGQNYFVNKEEVEEKLKEINK